MTTAINPHTIVDLERVCSDGQRHELVAGALNRMSPGGREHGRVAMKIAVMLARHVLDNGLGEVYAAETGFILARAPDTVRAPDAAFVRREHLAGLTNTRGFVPFAPDLAVEVVSPSDAPRDVESKARCWLATGTRMVLVVDPASESVHIYRDDDSRVDQLVGDDLLDARHAVEGWQIRIRHFFDDQLP